jgi:hydrogenase/urease accessory protein HupE
MRWANSAIVVSVIAVLAALCILGKLSGTDVLPMMTAVLTYALGFHVVTVNANTSDKDK